MDSTACYRSNHFSISGPIHHESKYHNIITSSSFHQIDERRAGPWEWRNETAMMSSFSSVPNLTPLAGVWENLIKINLEIENGLLDSHLKYLSVGSQGHGRGLLASKVTCQLYPESFVFICNPHKQIYSRAGSGASITCSPGLPGSSTVHFVNNFNMIYNTNIHISKCI